MTLNNSAVILKTAKACAQLHGLDYISGTSIYIKGKFEELKDHQKVILTRLSQGVVNLRSLK